MRRYATLITRLRINLNAPKRKVTISLPVKPSKGERAAFAALKRLLLILEHDLNDCTCPPPFVGLLKRRYDEPPPPFDTCPACELKQALRLKRKAKR